ncbi:MAG TPA: site-2 protease family protein, partial [Vicinamibacteria bacterium]|nr:site-2 protease family protein [Vicinamibacteria bacterium]
MLSSMLGRGFFLGTVFGVPIRIDYSWLVIAFLLTASLSLVFGQEYPYLGLPSRVLLGISGSLLLFGSVLAHELSHAVVAIRHRVGIRGITLFIFGGAAEMVDEPRTARAELEIAVAGPAMSLSLALVFGGLHYAGLGVAPLPLVDLADRLKWMNL